MPAKIVQSACVKIGERSVPDHVNERRNSVTEHHNRECTCDRPEDWRRRGIDCGRCSSLARVHFRIQSRKFVYVSAGKRLTSPLRRLLSPRICFSFRFLPPLLRCKALVFPRALYHSCLMHVHLKLGSNMKNSFCSAGFIDALSSSSAAR